MAHRAAERQAHHQNLRLATGKSHPSEDDQDGVTKRDSVVYTVWVSMCFEKNAALQVRRRKNNTWVGLDGVEFCFNILEFVYPNVILWRGLQIIVGNIMY